MKMIIKFNPSTQIIAKFKGEMESYRAFVCGYDVDNASRLRMFHQAAGVFCTYCDIYPTLADEFCDMWDNVYYPAMEEVAGDFYGGV